jgi:quercetin dioxygenase-like cupin family protein
MNRSRIVAAASLAAILVAGGAATTAQSPSAAPSMPTLEAQPVGAFTVGDIVGYPTGHAFSISVPAGTTVQSAMVTVPPGFDFGWHHHTGGVVVTVTSGTLTLYDTTCERQDVSAGGGFLEEVGTIHRARNEGTEPAVLLVTYLGVPAGQPTDVAESQGPCEIPS